MPTEQDETEQSHDGISDWDVEITDTVLSFDDDFDGVVEKVPVRVVVRMATHLFLG